VAQEQPDKAVLGVQARHLLFLEVRLLMLAAVAALAVNRAARAVLAVLAVEERVHLER
jgi:hypothetical protein